ncbi:hypothetical protein [Desulfobaculum sp. SPO524]
MEWIYDSKSHLLMTFVKTRNGRIMQIVAHSLSELRAQYAALIQSKRMTA